MKIIHNTTRNVLLAIVIACASVALLNACGGSDNRAVDTAVSPNDGSESVYRLRQLGDADDVLDAIKNALLQQYGDVADTGNDTIYETVSMAQPTAAPAASPDSGASGSSSTNVQEAGVDEADRLKTDGQHLFVAAADKPGILVFAADAQANKLAELALDTSDQYSHFKGLYLHNQKLFALSSPYRFGIYPLPMLAATADIAYGYSEPAYTEVFTVDVANASQPQQILKVVLDGELVSSRMIGDQLYLATRQTVRMDSLVYPQNSAEAVANKIKINAAQLVDFLPNYAVNGEDKGEIFAASDCFTTNYNTDRNALSIVSLLTIDTSSTMPRPQGQCFLGDIETLYASPAAIYLATTRYTYDTDSTGNAIYTGSVNTDLHRFAIGDNAAVTYSGSGRVAGHLGWYQDLKPFRLSEYNNTLRMITYTGNSLGAGGVNQSPAHLYNLQLNTVSAELEVVGQLPNAQRPAFLGKVGEQIYATRFAAERGYLVTYRLTDPLYVLDLSNPRDPFIAGELEIDGYSDYLHPISENLLLGVGKDAVVTSAGNTPIIGGSVPAPEVEVARGAWYQGVKLSLIDVSNPQQPTETQTLVLGKRGSETAASQSHHALTSLRVGNTMRVAIPLSRHDTVDSHSVSDSYHPSLPQFYYGWTQDELARFDIDINAGIITQRTSMVAERADDSQSYPYSAHWPQDRSVLANDRVYYLHGDKVLVADW